MAGHTKKVESLLSPGEKVESRYGPAEASIITMVEAQAAESSRKGGFVCRTHASTRTVLARRMGPGGAGAVRGRAEPSPQDSNPNSWEIGARNEGSTQGRAREWVSSPPISWRGLPAAAREASADASLGPEKALKPGASGL